MTMTLYELEWGLYPRRIGIYLAEKAIVGVERIAFDAMAGGPPPDLARLSPLGTVAILQTEDGADPILDRDPPMPRRAFPSPDLLGATSERRTRELVSVLN
jgi:glutathione S-transferase